MPAAVLGQHLVCLLNFELLIYTLRLARATNLLVQENIAPPEFDTATREFTPLDLYTDLTQKRGGRSDGLAYACVSRDIEAFETYFRSAQMLRTLDRYGVRHPELRNAPHEGGPYMVALNGLREDLKMQSTASVEIQDVLSRLQEGADSTIPQEVQFLLDSNLDDLSTMVEIITLSQRRYGINNLIKWYGDVGGMQRPDGLLRGNTKGKRAWRYVMSDMLLETLVQLAAVSPDARASSGNTLGANPGCPDSLALSAFLRFLRARFGLLIDTPPAFDQSVEATAAAKENFAALKQRLRQMGLFLDLSDDFNAQRIFPRYRESDQASV